MSKEYDGYIVAHKAAVAAALNWIKNEIGAEAIMDILPGLYRHSISSIIEAHDNSKKRKEEYEPYDAFFYGPNGVKREGGPIDEVRETFNKAFLLHIHSNPHHWQYWILKHDDPEFGVIEEEPIKMEDDYILEMICDWWSFSWRNGDLYTIFDWWNDHEDRIKMEWSTRRKVEALLRAISEKLNTEEYEVDPEKLTYKKIEDVWVEHSDDSEEDEEDKKYGVPELKKYPMPDAKHVRSAIKFFNYIDPKHEEELAAAILRRMEEYGIDPEELNVGDENRFKKYVNDHLEHHGITGMKWYDTFHLVHRQHP